jgi:hypothetical protein
MHRPRWLVASCALAAWLPCAAAGCGAEVYDAQAQFSKDTTCPSHAVVARALRVTTVPKQPPPDVASDPARLSEWRRADDARRALEDGRAHFSVEGCGQSRVYYCYSCTAGRERTVCHASPICVEAPSCRLSGEGAVVCDR